MIALGEEVKMYNPYYPYGAQQFQQNPVQPQNDDIHWVQGEAGASAAYVQPGHTAVFFDSTRDVFYVKSCDPMGKPQPIATYDFHPHVEQKAESPDLSQYVTKDELKKYIDDLFGGTESEEKK